MTTVDELTPRPLTVADVGQACAAMGHACWMRLISLRASVDAMSPDVAWEVYRAADMLRLYAAKRAGVDLPELVTAVEDPRLPGGAA